MSGPSNWPAKTPEQNAAYCKVYRARKAGKLKVKCEDCGRTNPSRSIQGHHHNGYKNALDVRMRCTGCHRSGERNGR